MHAVGPDDPAIPSKGLIAGYELSRTRPIAADPNVPQDWLDESIV